MFRTFEELKQLEQIETITVADDITLTTQLQSLTMNFGTSTLICDVTLISFEDPLQYNYRFIGRIKRNEKSKIVSVFEVFDTDDAVIKEKKNKSLSDYDKGIFYYYKKDFKKAVQFFKFVLDVNPEDKIAAKYIDRAEYFDKYESPPNWEYLESLLEDNI